MIFKTLKNSSYKILLLLFIPFFNACSVMYPNRMFDADKDYVYQTFLDSVPRDFTLAPGDQFELYVYPEKGYNLIQPQILGVAQQGNGTVSLQYTISEAGEANIPMIGFVKLNGLTESEAEKKLSALYEGNYINPFVNLQFTSVKTATVYRGSSEAKEVVLTRPDITLLEVVGIAGGVPQDAKTAKIKIIRKTDDTIIVQAIDLSEMNGIYEANKYIRPNDVIYIEPGLNPQLFDKIAPIISIATSIVVIYAYFSNINSK